MAYDSASQGDTWLSDAYFATNSGVAMGASELSTPVLPTFWEMPPSQRFDIGSETPEQSKQARRLGKVRVLANVDVRRVPETAPAVRLLRARGCGGGACGAHRRISRGRALHAVREPRRGLCAGEPVHVALLSPA